MAEKIIYKNHCTPQEQITFSDGVIGRRAYLDSDCGRRLTGNCESKYGGKTTDEISTGTGTLSDSGTYSIASCKFIFLKNTDTSGSDFFTIAIGDMPSVIKVSPGEAFACDVGNDGADVAVTVVITGSGTPGYEYLKGA